MSEHTLQFSANVDAEINQMARQLRIDTSNVTSMREAVITKALNLLKYVLDERDNGGRIFIDNYRLESRKEIRHI